MNFHDPLLAQTTAGPLQHFLRHHALLLLPPALGFFAIYWMMPKARQSVPVLGAVLGGVALILAGVFLGHCTGVWQETVLFYIFAAHAVIGAAMVVTLRNPVYGALAFALVILSSCGLFLLLGAPFLTAATIVVYAGAIVVTFLFVIMLAQQQGLTNADARTREPLLASLAGFALLGALIGVIQMSYDTRQVENLLGRLEKITQAKDIGEVDSALGTAKADQLSSPLVEELLEVFPTSFHVNDLDAQRGKLDEIKVTAKKVLEEIRPLARMHGSLVGDAKAEETVFAGAASNETPKPLPAKNVAALGRALFTEYLIPVLMAAVLLLVAPIGAIAIAHRNAEATR